MLRPLSTSRRSYVAQEVLDQLTNEILSGVFPEGSHLPSERVLAEKLQVSRVLVRQAIHRLAEMGLVTVRQGAPTQVGSLDSATGIGVLEVMYRLGNRLPARWETFIIERQYMNGSSLIELASQNGAPAEKAALLEWVDANPPQTIEAFLELEEQFWLHVARAGHNPIFEAELRWWYAATGGRMARPAQIEATPLALRFGFLRELARRLRDGDDPVAYYAAVTRPILATLRAD